MNKFTAGSLILWLVLLVGCNSNSNNGNQIKAKNSTPDLPVNVISVLLQGNYSLNNGDFPASQYDHGEIALTDSLNHPASLGETQYGNYEAHVVAGEYTSQYSVIQSSGTVPINKASIISSGLSLQNDQMLDINVEAYPVQFTFTLNNNSFPASEYDDALLYVKRTDGGEQVLLGNSHSPIDPVWLMPGTYDVVYEVETPGNSVPLNQHAVVGTVIVDSSTTNARINIVAVPIRLNVKLNSNDFAASEYQDGNLSVATADGDHADLGSTHDLPLNVTVIEGTYDFVYAHETGANVPANAQAVFADSQLIDPGHADFNLNILTALLTPQYSLNGNAFPISEYQDANIYLRSTGHPDDLFLLSNTHDPNPPAIMVVRGNYDVIYQHETGDEVPQNINAFVTGDIPINSDQVLPIAVEAVDITSSYTLNGNNFPVDAFNIAGFYFLGQEQGDEFLLGNSYTGQSTVKLIPGSYDVIYQHVHGNNVPQNLYHPVLSGVLLDASKNIQINVQSKSIHPVFSLNNQPFPKSIYEHARLYLQGSSPADQVMLGQTYLDNPAVMVIKDHYDVLYQYMQGSTLPLNDKTLITDVDIL